MAVNAGAIAQINHPSWSKHTMELVRGTQKASLLEVIQHFDTLSYDAAVWDGALTAGLKLFGTGMDDAHNYTTDFNTAWIMVRADTLTVPAILGAIRTGQFYASNGAMIDSIVTEEEP